MLVKYMMKSSLSAVFLVLSMAAFAVVEVVEFSDESLRPRYQQLIQELRCPKCQNQNLADSNSPISQDLRREIQRMLEEGMSDTEIKSYLQSRYSDFILYRPEVKKTTWFLWGAPLLILLLGLAVAITVFRRQGQQSEKEIMPKDEQNKKLEALLAGERVEAKTSNREEQS